MGVIYKGKDPDGGRTVAIKTVRRDTVLQEDQSETQLARFKREAEAANALLHPNIVTVYEYGEDGDIAFMVMEFIEGRSLKEFLDEGFPFTLTVKIKIITQILNALDYSHRKGIIHRDIKPSNVMLNAAGEVKITDFGIARIESSSLTAVGTVLGTPSYMSPEQYRAEQVTVRSDLFSAGALFYELLTGVRPFTGSLRTVEHKILNETAPQPSSINPDIPAGLDAIVAKAMAKAPEHRYPSVIAFLDAIEATLADADETVRGFPAIPLDQPATDPDETVGIGNGSATGRPAPVAEPPPPAHSRGEPVDPPPPQGDSMQTNPVDADEDTTVPGNPVLSQSMVRAVGAAEPDDIDRTDPGFFSESRPRTPMGAVEPAEPAPPVPATPTPAGRVWIPVAIAATMTGLLILGGGAYWVLSVAPDRTTVVAEPDGMRPTSSPTTDPVIPEPDPGPGTPSGLDALPDLTPPAEVTVAGDAAPPPVSPREPDTVTQTSPPPAPPPVSSREPDTVAQTGPPPAPPPVSPREPDTVAQTGPPPAPPPSNLSGRSTDEPAIKPKDDAPGHEARADLSDVVDTPTGQEPPAADATDTPVTPASPADATADADGPLPDTAARGLLISGSVLVGPDIIEDTGDAKPPAPDPVEPAPEQVAVSITATLDTLHSVLAGIDCSSLQAHGDDRAGILVTGWLGDSVSRETVLEVVADAATGFDHALDVSTFPSTWCPVMAAVDRHILSRGNDDRSGFALVPERPGAVFQDGDYLRLRIQGSAQSTYVQIDYFLRDGHVVHLLPNPLEPNHRLPADGQRDLGDPDGGGRYWIVGPPFGRELILAIASHDPLFPQPRPEVERTADYLRALRNALDAQTSNGPHRRPVVVPLVVTTRADTGG